MQDRRFFSVFQLFLLSIPRSFFVFISVIAVEGRKGRDQRVIFTRSAVKGRSRAAFDESLAEECITRLLDRFDFCGTRAFEATDFEGVVIGGETGGLVEVESRNS